MGDFNDILSNDEKSGGLTRPEYSFREFRSFVSETRLYDLPYSGNCLSWRGNRHNYSVRCRLDRVMAEEQWIELFPNSKSSYLWFEGSDHKPLLITLEPEKQKKKSIFRFDRRLRDNEEVKKVIAKAWLPNTRMLLDQRLNRTRKAIIQWCKEKRKNSEKEVDNWKHLLEEAMCKPGNNITEISNINRKLSIAYEEEEEFWRQRSRVLWLQLGDKNSSYFHATTKMRKQRNHFVLLENEDGEEVVKEEQITEVLINYFTSMYSSSGQVSSSIVRETIEARITQEENESLVREVSEAEIKSAAFSIHEDKAPGPDGFSAAFFRENWETLGPSIITEIKDFFQTGVMNTSMNATLIRLIPKTHNPKKPAEYRPIALCNYTYKVISKLLAKRLRNILRKVISDNQSAFALGRSISDNLLITHEILHSLKTSQARKYGAVAVKTDMTKAYDRLEWNIIQEVMIAMGFHRKFVHWIMQCVSTVHYSIIVNEEPKGYIKPTRGIRQGDPISPYLFIICSEILSGLCKKAQEKKKMMGVRISKNGPWVNHLLFADDTMFFCQGSSRNIKTLQKIITTYESVTGQLINKGKSAITFSKKMDNEQKIRIKNMLQISQEGGCGKYLGLPEQFGRSKKDLFSNIIDKIHQKRVNWATKNLSQGGKEIMLKSILSSMPSYAMTCFLLPKSLCKKIQSEYTRFWWDKSMDKRSISWIAWKRLVQPKKRGGLGFRDVKAFNLALVAKVSWKLLNNPNTLIGKMMLAKYCKGQDFLTCSKSNNCSYAWKGIISGRDLLRQKLGWSVGNGEKISLWKDSWLSTTQAITPIGPPNINQGHLMVADLINQDSKTWNNQKVEEILPSYAGMIYCIKLGKCSPADKQIWLPHKSGEYTAMTGYYTALEEKTETNKQQFHNQFDWTNEIWSVKLPPKLKHFLWKLIHEALPVGANLQKRKMEVNTECKRCGEEETCSHLFWQCPFAKSVWRETLIMLLPEHLENTNSAIAWKKVRTSKTLPPVGINSTPLGVWICWRIWKARNKLIFQQLHSPSSEIVLDAIVSAKEWQLAQSTNPRVKSTNPGLPIRRKQNSVMIMTDAAWNKENLQVGTTCIILENKSEITSTAVEEFVPSPLVAEALAIRSSLQLARNLDLQRIEILSDSQIIIKAINSGHYLSEVHGVLSDIFHLLQTFISSAFHFVNRELIANADALAKRTLRQCNM